VLKNLDEGAGFYTRNDDKGVDDEIDIDGDDQVTFGDAQFTEGDIFPINTELEAVGEDVEVEIMGDNDDEAQLEQMTLRDLIASGKIAKRPAPGKGEESVKCQMGNVMGIAEAEKLDLAILLARERGDKTFLMSALENKLKYMVRVEQFSVGDRVTKEFSPGIYTSSGLGTSSLSNLYRPIYRTDCVDRLLAYVLQGVLVEVSWFNKTMSHLQANYRRRGLAQSIPLSSSIPCYNVILVFLSARE
jgi:hypothetical protein